MSEPTWARASALVAVALGLAAVTLQAVQAETATTAPSVGARPVLAAPVSPPAGTPPTIGTDRWPDARAQRDGVLLELWVPEEPVRMGSWLPVTVRISNMTDHAVRHAGAVGDYRCQNPADTVLRVDQVFDPGANWDGRSATFKQTFLESTPVGSMPLDLVDSNAAPECRARIAPGSAVVMQLATWPRYAFRDQPLPDGAATVVASFSFWQPGGSAAEQTSLQVAAPVSISGAEVSYPSPQAIVDVVLANKDFAAWLESRDLTKDWNIDLAGIYAPEEHTFAGLHYAGGEAPVETIGVGVFASPDVDGYARVAVDPWTATVESVSIQ